MRRLLTIGVLLAVSFLLSTTVLVFAANTFWDVPENAWYAESVESLAEKNILQGNPDGSFQPNDPVTRAEMAVLLDRTLEYLKDGEVDIDKPMTSAYLDVPFSSQAPTGTWVLPYAEACEETSIIMVKAFLAGETLDKETATNEIVALTSYVESEGMGVDISAEQVAQVAEDFYRLKATVYFDDEVTVENIKALLNVGHPVIIPASGHSLANPNYTDDGPPYHMIVIVGYNEEGLITHDPGTQFGASYVYSFETIDKAIHDWAGSKSNVEEGRRAMVVLTN